ncbi:MAG: oligosaccharide flippase family protein [Treponema sp.]|nr:oligosaccharide flippase family protein [Treponema sp.]
MNFNEVKEKISVSLQKGAVHIFAGSLLTRFVSFFASVIVVRVLSKSDYGILSYYENLYNYFFLLAGYGLAKSVLRYVVITDDINEKKSIIQYCKNKGTLFNIALIIIGVCFSLLYKHPSQFSSKNFYLIIMLLFLPFQYIVNLYIYNERAFCDNKRYAAVSFLYVLLLVSFKFCGALLWQLIGAVILPLVIHLIYSVFLTVIDEKKYFKNAKPFNLSTSLKKEMDIYSIQCMVTNGLWALFALNSTFILGRMIGNAELVADYKIATVLPSFISILSSSLGIFVGPYFTKHESEKDYEWCRKNWIIVILVSTFLIGLVVMGLFLFAPFMITLVFGEKYVSSFPIMRLLLIAALFDAGIRYPTAHLLTSMNKIKYNMIVSVIGIVLQLIFAVLFAYHYGVIGIAAANILVQFTMSLAITFFFVYYFFIKTPQKGDLIEK